MVKLSSHPYNTRSKGKKKMTHKDGNESDNNEVQNQRCHKKQCQPKRFGLYDNAFNVDGTSTVRPLSIPMASNPFFVPIVPTNSVPQPIMEPKFNNDPPPKVQYDRDYTLEVTFKIPDSYPYTYQYSSPVALVEAENTVKNEEHEEMARKMKSLEHSVRDMQGLGGHKRVSFNDLCIFSNVYLSIDFKAPKFEKYDRHGVTVVHLKRYCNQLRGAGSGEELLMAYFGESLMETASE
ncbi:hypothetical protein RDI58_003915 [Solanum bulbocastanum]|uniref:Uncharacterized protein n=1 Tax=Solanum bulbocastanum TaxID=147425 RepID=A0AAN8U063_SOLBU